MTVPNTRPKVGDQVFGTLLEAILSGRYAAGEKLPGQRALARDLGVTVTALREGLKRLEQMGLIDVRHGDAMRVNAVREHATLDVLTPLMLHEPGILADVFEARTLMLSEMAALAARRRTDDQADGLTRLAAAMAATDGPRDVDFAWATELAAAAGNLVFVLILNAIRDAYFAQDTQLPVADAGDGALYARIAEAIAARDENGARTAARDLAERQRERVVGAKAKA